MRPLPEYERLHRQLEKHLPYKHGKEQLDQPQPPTPSATTQNDSEIDTLVALAHHVQQLHAGFAQRLEVRILSHHVALRQQEVAKKRGSRFFSPSFRMAIVGAVALICFLLGTSLLALAAPITNPNNPLYAIKNWEQHVQLSLAHPPSNQTQASQPIAHHPLSTPTSIARNHISQNAGNSNGNRFGTNGAWQNGNEQSGKSIKGIVPTTATPHDQNRGGLPKFP